MYVLVSIDTEEDMPQWRPEPVTTTKNIQTLPKFNDMCQQHSVIPTYLTDRPVLEDDAACEIMASLNQSGTCEIGMHLHSWNTPPIDREEAQGKATVLNLFPESIQARKIMGFHKYFSERLGFDPTSYRAGRYGMTPETAEILAELGYRIETSVAPLRDYSDYGAPNFENHDYHPFWIKTSIPHRLLEIPITIELVTRLPSAFRKFYFSIPDATHIKGVLNRLNLARLIWMRPTNYTYKEMRQLAEFIIARQIVPVFNIMFHSSELCPGMSPYNITEKDVTKFCDRFFNITDFLIKECGALSVTLSQFADIAEQLDYPVKAVGC